MIVTLMMYAFVYKMAIKVIHKQCIARQINSSVNIVFLPSSYLNKITIILINHWEMSTNLCEKNNPGLSSDGAQKCLQDSYT
jgi:hypothetical protein